MTTKDLLESLLDYVEFGNLLAPYNIRTSEGERVWYEDADELIQKCRDHLEAE